MEFQPGNYSVKWREFLAKQMRATEFSREDKTRLNWLDGVLASAPHFGLPDDGIILERDAANPYRITRDVDATEVINPPYDEVVIEFAANLCSGGMNQHGVSTRRIVVAFRDREGAEPRLVILPIYWFDKIKAWSIPAFGVGIRPSGTQVEVSCVDFLPDYAQYCRSGAEVPRGYLLDETIIGDAQAEVNAYMDMVQALSCINVGVEVIRQPKSLNRARASSRKLKLVEYKVLKISATKPNGGCVGGAGRSPRAHLRRGHIRRLQSGKRTWVNATFVRGNGEGFVHKSYQVAPQQ